MQIIWRRLSADDILRRSVYSDGLWSWTQLWWSDRHQYMPNICIPSSCTKSVLCPWYLHHRAKGKALRSRYHTAWRSQNVKKQNNCLRSPKALIGTPSYCAADKSAAVCTEHTESTSVHSLRSRCYLLMNAPIIAHSTNFPSCERMGKADSYFNSLPMASNQNEIIAPDCRPLEVDCGGLNQDEYYLEIGQWAMSWKNAKCFCTNSYVPKSI